MSRIMFPATFIAQTKLRDDIDAKHIADGANSALNPFFIQQGIDFSTTAATAAQALTYDQSRGLYARQAENFRELSDHLFDAPFTHLRGMAQFLKSFYKGNTHELGVWGITVNNNKLVYPTDFTGRYNLLKAFTDNYTATAATSPLNAYLRQNGIDINADRAAADTANKQHDQMTAAANNAENQRELRDNTWAPVQTILRNTADYLKKLHGDNPRAAGGWGITIDDSPRAPKMRNTTLKPGESITIDSAAIGGHFTNNGSADLHLYRGKTTTGTPVTVHSGEDFGILRGWSTFTVVNPNTLAGGKFSVLSSHN